MNRARTIAVDGPAGSGKSTIGKLIADTYGYTFLDTGALYRAITLAAIRHHVCPGDAEALAELARETRVCIEPPDQGEKVWYHVRLDGEDVTSQIRSPEVDRHVSEVSSHPSVRAVLLERQREIARSGPSVLVGRDIGTVVLPDADLKLFLTATVEERARRRYRDMARAGKDVSFEWVLEDVERRDEADRNKGEYSLRVAEDAVVVDTTGRTPEQIVAELRPWIVGE